MAYEKVTLNKTCIVFANLSLHCLSVAVSNHITIFVIPDDWTASFYYEFETFESVVTFEDTIFITDILNVRTQNITAKRMLLLLPIRGTLGSNCSPKNDVFDTFTIDLLFHENFAKLRKIKIQDCFLPHRILTN